MKAIKLVQLSHNESGRRVALVDEPNLILLDAIVTSSYNLVMEALDKQVPIGQFITSNLSLDTLDYDPIYRGTSAWKLLPAFDHPDNPYACLVSGTGLTHHSSAKNRQMMHLKDTDKLTDSMKIYQWGVAGGSPPPGVIGIQPEWFYKGTGAILKAHGEPLEVPPYATDGGEEAEIAGVYVIDKDGTPVRIGYCNGNEFSDHVMESKNYLYLAPSKLRHCAIGPELVIGLDFEEFFGYVKIIRDGKEIWKQSIKSGNNNMAHSLANLEHHHFKYEAHRVSGQAHVHFFGADAFSFGNQLFLQSGDISEVSWEKLGRPLRSPIHHPREKEKLVTAKSI